MEHQSSRTLLHSPSRKAELLLLVLFVISLPLLNPWIRGDGVGYYAFARAPLIGHNLDFAPDYEAANPSFREGRLDENGQPKDLFRTRTGHLDNHFTVGPAILWSPFLLITHGGVLLARAFGSSIAADGFCAPYRIALAFGTALYGFAGLLLAFRLARRYVLEIWALFATIGIWWASSLTVYMYFNPSWSHAHSAFVVALFLWYWDATRETRTLQQWLLLGAIVGLMLNVYYANLMVLAVLVVEAAPQYFSAFRGQPDAKDSLGQLLTRHLLFGAVVVLCLLPTFITRTIVYGGPFETGYLPLRDWLWRSPAFLEVLFSSNHGLLVWTPVVVLSVAGLILFSWRFPQVGTPFLAAAVAFYLFICCYPDWAGISSFGNRFFVSLTALFILGLSVVLEHLASLFRSQRRALAAAYFLLLCFIVWNLGFIFQWGSHLVPARGPISWNQMIYNQFHVVPRQITTDIQTYLFKRHLLMQRIEQRDMEQLKKESEP